MAKSSVSLRAKDLGKASRLRGCLERNNLCAAGRLPIVEANMEGN
jgi:hypothetical protein